DTQHGVRWVAMFKGGVYAVQKGKAYLLLPRPAYRGAEKLEFDGDWLVVHATVATDPARKKYVLQPVARYNRKSSELQLLIHEP
ncbi:MAG: hypothetical protein OEV31_04395, partial [Gammaproteobacteria bacterium]|nr:hypothetical protein [Gammaproteobacteria bacterium]